MSQFSQPILPSSAVVQVPPGGLLLDPASVSSVTVLNDPLLIGGKTGRFTVAGIAARSSLFSTPIFSGLQIKTLWLWLEITVGSATPGDGVRCNIVSRCMNFSISSDLTAFTALHSAVGAYVYVLTPSLLQSPQNFEFWNAPVPNAFGVKIENPAGHAITYRCDAEYAY